MIEVTFTKMGIPGRGAGCEANYEFLLALQV